MKFTIVFLPQGAVNYPLIFEDGFLVFVGWWSLLHFILELLNHSQIFEEGFLLFFGWNLL